MPISCDSNYMVDVDGRYFFHCSELGLIIKDQEKVVKIMIGVGGAELKYDSEELALQSYDGLKIIKSNYYMEKHRAVSDEIKRHSLMAECIKKQTEQM